MSNADKFEVQIIRLKGGEDVIGFVYSGEGYYEIKYPKTFFVNFDSSGGYEELIITDWLPRRAYALQEAYIESSDVLLVAYPAYEFGIDYLNDLLRDLDMDSNFYEKVKCIIETAEQETMDENIVENPRILH